ncbi:MAG: cyclic 2,3-diphosphoglycerate synthase [Gammaproteobacteria bacterium]|nr:cyclic 2,3-diphosphoglycerate synthase [Gammaproteobacteria bacterium]
MEQDRPTRVVIMGAAGRDFHNFNTVYRDNPDFEVVAFTATQIPEIADRRYPAQLAGKAYADGIPIVDEAELEALCHKEDIDQVTFAYSDVSHAHVMHKASIVLASGADFVLLGPERTMLRANVPVIATSAVRTGCGKSQTTRWLSKLLKQHGLKVAVIRHPMPYGDLENQAVQRFASNTDLYEAKCTVEEREEYEPHIALGNVVFAGVDYAGIVALAESECDVILWDGGNNDFPFVRPDLHIVLIDPLRAGNETTHHPGEAVLRMADIMVVVKVNTAREEDIERVSQTARQINETASLVQGASPVQLDDPQRVKDMRVLIVEDGPTITHGGMAYGAGYVAATQTGVKEIVDPRSSADDEIANIYTAYPHIGRVLPAIGYHQEQLQALGRTINAADADIVIAATPCDLSALVELNKPVARVAYEFAEAGDVKLSDLVLDFLRSKEFVN